MYSIILSRIIISKKKKKCTTGSYLFESTFNRIIFQNSKKYSSIDFYIPNILTITNHTHDATFLYHRYKAPFTSRDSPLSFKSFKININYPSIG